MSAEEKSSSETKLSFTECDEIGVWSLLTQSGVIVLDLRSAESYASHRLHKAVNVDISGDPAISECLLSSDSVLLASLPCKSTDRLTKINGNSCLIYADHGRTLLSENQELLAALVSCVRRTKDQSITARSLRDKKLGRQPEPFVVCVFAGDLSELVTQLPMLVEFDSGFSGDVIPRSKLCRIPENQVASEDLAAYSKVFLKCNLPSVILDDWSLFLGDARQATNPWVPHWLGVTHIVNVTSTIPCAFDPSLIAEDEDPPVSLAKHTRGVVVEPTESDTALLRYYRGQSGVDCVKYHRMSIEDAIDQDVGSVLSDALDFIKDAHEQGGRVLVHCQMGVSRSATVVTAALMALRKMTLYEAYSTVKRRRSKVSPNESFLLTLIELEKQLFEGVSTFDALCQAGCGIHALPEKGHTETEGTLGSVLSFLGFGSS